MGKIDRILPIRRFDAAYAPTYNSAQFLRMSSDRVSSLHSGPKGDLESASTNSAAGRSGSEVRFRKCGRSHHNRRIF